MSAQVANYKENMPQLKENRKFIEKRGLLLQRRVIWCMAYDTIHINIWNVMPLMIATRKFDDSSKNINPTCNIYRA